MSLPWLKISQNFHCTCPICAKKFIILTLKYLHTKKLLLLLKNHNRNIRHHLHLKIQRRIMLKTKVILTCLVIGFLAFESCQAFYRQTHSFIEKTLNKILQDQLERRFGKLPAITTTQTTTTAVETTTRSASKGSILHPKTLKVKVCEFKTFEACTIDEWSIFLRTVLKNQRHWKLPRKTFWG